MSTYNPTAHRHYPTEDYATNKAIKAVEGLLPYAQRLADQEDVSLDLILLAMVQAWAGVEASLGCD